MTGKPSTDTANAAVKRRVFDDLMKLSRLADISEILGRVAERRNLDK